MRALVALALHILCGFSAEEICKRLLCGHREACRKGEDSDCRSKKRFDIAAAIDFSARLPATYCLVTDPPANAGGFVVRLGLVRIEPALPVLGTGTVAS
jgi:hypothetical protein